MEDELAAKLAAQRQRNNEDEAAFEQPGGVTKQWDVEGDLKESYVNVKGTADGLMNAQPSDGGQVKTWDVEQVGERASSSLYRLQR